ncbi:hypothetical protein A2U01_0094159, partial [Trifolium medium]|nr:hypothetical protein [Trifolium medium]
EVQNMIKLQRFWLFRRWKASKAESFRGWRASEAGELQKLERHMLPHLAQHSEFKL